MQGQAHSWSLTHSSTAQTSDEDHQGVMPVSQTKLISEHLHSLEINTALCTRPFLSDLTIEDQNSSKAEGKM